MLSNQDALQIIVDTPGHLDFTFLQGFFCDSTRRYGVPGNENDKSIVCMSA